MKCIVRMRKAECDVPEVFIPKKMKAEDLMRQMWEEERVRLSADDDVDEDETTCGEKSAIVYTKSDNCTEFFIRTVVEVEG